MRPTPLLCCVTVLVLLCGVPAANAAVQHNSVNFVPPQGDAASQMAEQANEMAAAGEQPTDTTGGAPIMPAPGTSSAENSFEQPVAGSTNTGGQYIPPEQAAKLLGHSITTKAKGKGSAPSLPEPRTPPVPSLTFAQRASRYELRQSLIKEGVAKAPKKKPDVAYFGFPTGGYTQQSIFSSPQQKLNWEKAVLLSRRRRSTTRAPVTRPPTPSPTPKPETLPPYLRRIVPTPVPNVTLAQGPPIQQAKVCGATTSLRTTRWKLHGTGGLYFDVTTTHCKFKAMPSYISSVVGDAAHWTLQGSHCISKATAKSFRVVVLHPSMRGDTLLRAAKNYKWVVSWIGNIGGNSGTTPTDKLKWKQTKKGSLYMDVDTTSAAFHATPRYFSTLHGHEKHWRTEGAHIVYFPKPTGFRTYIIFDECFGGTCVDKKVTPKDADKYKWTIHWVGTVSERAPDASAYCVKDSNGHDASGQSGTDWKKAPNGKAGLFMLVDTSSSQFKSRPTYVSSVTTHYAHWRVTGAGSIFSPAQDSFKLYLAKALYTNVAKLYKWKVNYLGYDGPVDCQVSPVWSAWSKCSKSCDTGQQARARTVFQEAFNGGVPCPLTKQTRPCNPNKCPPIDCRVSNWTKWAPCTMTCANGTTYHVRSVVQLPKHGPQYSRAGKACPILRETKSCNTDPCPIDCKVSGWSSWTKCYSPPSVHCGVGFRHRAKKVVIFPEYGGEPCPKRLAQTKTCYHKGNCVGRGHSAMCGGHTPRGSLPHDGLAAIGQTEWETFGEHGITVDVDTSSCGFKMTPQYVVQVMGLERNAFFGFLSGLNSVTRPTKTGFKLTIWYENLSAKDLLGAAHDYRWYVSWVGETGRNAGITVSGKTGWKQDSSTGSANTIYADVNTALSGYISKPRYFAALHGDEKTEQVQGPLVVYNPTATGFRLYVTAIDPLKPAQAEAANWTVSWVGVENAGAGPALPSQPPATVGVAGEAWKKKGTMLGSVLYKAVSLTRSFTAPKKLYVAPLVIPSVELHSTNWQMIGSASLSQPTMHGFDFALGKVNLDISLSKQKGWRVNYLAYQVMDCKLSTWSQWSACSKTCAGGVQTRVRKVIVPHGRGGQACPPVPLSQHKVCSWRQCVGVGASKPCGALTPERTNWQLNMSTAGHAIYVDVDASSCGFKSPPYFFADIVGERFHWELTGSITLSRWRAGSFRATAHHPHMSGLTLLRAAKKNRWRVSWIGESGMNAGITSPGKSGWRQASDPEISDWTLQLEINTRASGFAATPKYFTSLVGEMGQYRPHGTHVVYDATRMSFKVYLMADRFLSSTEAEKHKWAVAWMGTRSRHAGTSGTNWKAVSDASMNVEQARQEVTENGIGVYQDVNMMPSQFAVPPALITSISANAGGIRTMWRMHGTAAVYRVTTTGFQLYQSTAPSAIAPQQHMWRVNYLGFEPNFCKVSQWGVWKQACPCKMQTRTRTLLVQGDSNCHPPALSQSTKPCVCVVKRTQAPVLTKARAVTLPPTVSPTMAPTKAPLNKVTMNVDVSTETVASFSAPKQLQFRKQLVVIISAGLYEDLTLDDVKIEHVASVSSDHATTTRKGISVSVQIMVPFNDNPHAVVDAILSQTFKSLFAEKLYEQGLGIMANSLSTSRPQIVSLATGAGATRSSSAASAVAATQRQKKLVLLGIGGFVVLVYVVLGVAALCRRTGSAGSGAGTGTGHELTTSASGTRISEHTPLARNSDIVAAGQKGGVAVTPDGLGGDMDDGGVFI